MPDDLTKTRPGPIETVGIRDDRDHHCGSAGEDFAIEVRAELSEGAAAARLFAAVPAQHG